MSSLPIENFLATVLYCIEQSTWD